MSSSDFTLWLEFEEVQSGNCDIEHELCNIHVDLTDGRHYGITIWIYKFLETAITNARQTGKNLGGLNKEPPDLFVQEPAGLYGFPAFVNLI